MGKQNTEKQRNARKHNWLILQARGVISSMEQIINSQTTTEKEKELAAKIQLTTKALDYLLHEKRDHSNG